MKKTVKMKYKFVSPPIKTEPCPSTAKYESGFGHPKMSPRAPQPIKASKVTAPPLPVYGSQLFSPSQRAFYPANRGG